MASDTFSDDYLRENLSSNYAQQRNKSQEKGAEQLLDATLCEHGKNIETCPSTARFVSCENESDTAAAAHNSTYTQLLPVSDDWDDVSTREKEENKPEPLVTDRASSLVRRHNNKHKNTQQYSIAAAANKKLRFSLNFEIEGERSPSNHKQKAHRLFSHQTNATTSQQDRDGSPIVICETVSPILSNKSSPKLQTQSPDNLPFADEDDDAEEEDEDFLPNVMSGDRRGVGSFYCAVAAGPATSRSPVSKDIYSSSDCDVLLADMIECDMISLDESSSNELVLPAVLCSDSGGADGEHNANSSSQSNDTHTQATPSSWLPLKSLETDSVTSIPSASAAEFSQPQTSSHCSTEKEVARGATSNVPSEEDSELDEFLSLLREDTLQNSSTL